MNSQNYFESEQMQYSDRQDTEAAGLIPAARSTGKIGGVMTIHEANMKAIEIRQRRVRQRVNAPRGPADISYQGNGLENGSIYDHNGSHSAFQRDTQQHYTTTGFYNADTEARMNEGPP